MKLHTKVFDLDFQSTDGKSDGHLSHQFVVPDDGRTFSPRHETVERGGQFFHVVSWAEATTEEEIEELKQQKAMLRAQRSGIQMGPR